MEQKKENDHSEIGSDKPEQKPTPNADKPEPKPDSKPAPKDDKDALKSLPMPELMKKLASSADGLTQADAEKRLAQYGPNEITERRPMNSSSSSRISGAPSLG